MKLFRIGLVGSVAVTLVALGSGCGDSSDDSGEGGAGGDTQGKDGSGGQGSGGAPSEGAPAGIESVSGSRLQQVWLVGDGARRPERIHDSKLDVACEFGITEDGETRCVPLFAEAVAYADADCSEPLLPVFEDACGATSKNYGKVYLPPEECGATRVQVLRGGQSVATPAQIYRLTQGKCNSETTNPEDKYVGATAVEPSEFVSADRVVVDATEQLGVAFSKSEDGGYFYEGPVNLSEQRRCSIAENGASGDWTYHCIMDAALKFQGGSYGYVDDACTVEAALSQGLDSDDRCAEPEAVVEVQLKDGCVERRILEVGERLDQVYEKDGAACGLATQLLVPGGRYSSGAPASGLVDVDLGLAESAGRLAQRLYTQEDRAIQAQRQFWDSKFDAPCWETRLGDQIVCVPSPFVSLGSSIESGIYIDAACTKRVVYGGNVPECDAPEEFHAILEQGDGLCSGPQAVYGVAATHRTTVTYQDNGGSCDQQTSLSEQYWVEVGDQLEPTEVFAVLNEQLGE